ncbi:hypothetical protein MMC07_002494 [Pseudocyphellaria aurata]|nr:hypothetical protein [Pseudocyphellaria aurata]
MSTRSKKRHSTPKTKPGVRKPTSASVSKKRQETLTQIGFVVYQQPEEIGLKYDDDANEDSEEIPRASKRRKTSKAPAMLATRQTRGSARRAAERADEDADDEENIKLEPNNSRVALEASKALMPPPQTPQSTRRKEVPSSQSPADTPTSTQSHKARRDLSRSPLKERSTNVRRVDATDSARTSVRWAQMLEVADSTEQDDEESPPSIPAPEVSSSPPAVSKLNNDTTFNPVTGATLLSSNAEVRACPQQQSLDGGLEDSSTPISQNIKSEVSDSETNEEDDDDFSVEIDTQAAFDALDSQLISRDIRRESISINNTQTPRRALKPSEPVTSFKERDRHSESSLINDVQEPNIGTTLFTSNTQSLHPRLSRSPMSPQPPQRAMALSSSAQSILHSESEEVSFQLTNDLHSHTQSCRMPETESQFENAWHEYKPAPPPTDEDQDSRELDDSRLSNLTPRALDSETLERNLPYDESQLPIQRPRAEISSSSNPLQQRRPSSTRCSPLSQTTTDETTQPSSAHASPQQLHSSPPLRPLPYSSSPLQSGAAAADRYAGEWDGVPLTESQLLPDSLMNGTIVGPPSLDGDDWELEREG